MKYKLIYNLFRAYRNSWKSVCILSVLIVSACSDHSTLLTATEEPGLSVDTAYVSLAIDFNSYTMKRGYGGDEQGLSEEDFVNKVRLVLYDGEEMSSKVVKCFDFEIRTNSNQSGAAWIDGSVDGKDLAGTTNPADYSQFITYARKVPSMDLKMLVIINIPAELKALTEEGCLYQSIVKEGKKIETNNSKSGDVGGLAGSRNFLMTSGPGLITIHKDKLKASIREAHNDPVAATVSRVTSKVTVLSSDGGDTFLSKNGALVGNVSWELDITNRYTYWTIHGLLDANRENWYWTDPNYAGYGTKSFSELENDFFYFASLGNPYPIFKNKVKTPEYCLENTMDETDQNHHNVITRALIRCIYKPVNVPSLGESFYVYNGNTYSINEMKEFAQEADKLPESLLTGFYKAIKDAREEEYSFSSGKPWKNNREVTEPFTTKGITYYYNGINYYAIKVRHRGTDDLTTGYAHYGVLRNTHYKITVERINGPGSPGILWDDITTRSAGTENSRLYHNIESSILIQ